MQQDLLNAIEIFYDSAEESEPDKKFDYNQAMTAYSKATGDTGAVISIINISGMSQIQAGSCNIPHDALAVWQEPFECPVRDKIFRFAPLAPEHVPLLRRTFVPDSEFFGSAIHERAYKPWGHHCDGGSRITVHNNEFVMLGFVRHREQREVDAEILTSMALLNRHLQRAINLHSRISKLEQTLLLSSKALDLIEFGLVLYGQDSKPVYVNSSARIMFGDRQGIELTKSGLSIGNNQTAEQYTNLLENLFRPQLPIEERQGGVVSVPRKSGNGAYVITLVPINPDINTNGISGAAFIFDPEKKKTTAASLFKQTYHLTNVEAELAQNLVLGESLETIAENRNVTYNTMKSHLHSVFSKTETNRQAELVSLLLRSVAGLNLEP